METVTIIILDGLYIFGQPLQITGGFKWTCKEHNQYNYEREKNYVEKQYTFAILFTIYCNKLLIIFCYKSLKGSPASCLTGYLLVWSQRVYLKIWHR